MTMNRRRFLGVGLGAVGALALGACARGSGPGSDGAGPGGRPTVRLAAGLPSFPSPFSYFLAPGYNQMILIYDTLLLSDATGRLLPWLVSEMPTRSDDGLTYTMQLREGIRWHDGEPLTAEDVVFTFDYFAGQTLAPSVSVQPRHVAGVRATGPGTLEFRLDLSIVDFDQAVAGAVPIIPRHIWSEVSDAARAQDVDLLVGSGPYRLESYSQAESSYLYVANDDFFLGKPFVQRLEFVPVPNELDALLAGEVEVAQPDVEGAGADALAPFRQNDEFEVIEGPAGTGFFAALSWSVAREGPVSDRRFRHACAMAIDRQEMVDRLLGGLGATGNPGFFPPDHPFRVDVEQYAFDPGEANRLLEEAGYRRTGLGPRQGPDGQPLRLSLLSAGAPPATELVVRSLEAVGVGIEVESVELFQAFSRLNNGDYEMAVHPGGGVAGSPDFMRQIYSSQPDTELFFAAHGYENPEFDDLAERQRVTFDEAERKEIFARMQEIVAEDLPLLHLYYPSPFLIQRRGGFDAWAFPDPETLYNQETASSGKQSFVTGRTSGLEIHPTE